MQLFLYMTIYPMEASVSPQYSLLWYETSGRKTWLSHLPVSFGLHDIGALTSQLLQSLSDHRLLLVLILLKQVTVTVNGESTKARWNPSLNMRCFTCGRSCVRCLSLSVCFRPSRSSSAFLFWMIDRRSWTWKINTFGVLLSTFL